MSETFTDADLRNQVAETLGSEGDEATVKAIVDEIQSAYGTVHLDEVPPVIYWHMVERHTS